MTNFEPVLQYNISSLIEQQFPAYFREEGQVFVQFVKEYYKWLETSQEVSDTTFNGVGHLHIVSSNSFVTGIGTNFDETLIDGDKVAIYYPDSKTDYHIFTVNNIVNSSSLYLTSNSLPDFSSGNSFYTTIKVQNNPNYYLRRFFENKDIDLTVDQFLVYFKEKYLKNIQFDTKANIRNLLKHSLDLYRSKGTERSIDLAFRAVFNVPANVYYPGSDLFRLSDGKWYRPTYLEISIVAEASKLIGKQIMGATSGATAFAEALVRRTVKNRVIDVLYISAVKGNFIVDEPINSSDNILSVSNRPNIIGSLTTLLVDPDGTGANYKVGDVVDLYSTFGEQGKAKVVSVSDTTGQVTFELINGGYGYRSTAQVLISENIIQVANLTVHANNTLKSYVDLFDQFNQPLANVVYNNLTVSNVVTGDAVFTYHANNLLKGTGRIIKVDAANTISGNLLISVLSGSFNDTNLYTTANAKSANITTYTNASVTGNTIGYYSNVNIFVTNKSGDFTLDEEIYQVDQYGLQVANASMAGYTVSTATTGELRIANTKGVFISNTNIRGRLSNATANIQTTTIFAGLTSISNTIFALNGNYVYFANSLSNGTVSTVSLGSLANVTFANNLLYTESVALPNDYISPYLSTNLNAATYAFPGFPSGNLTNGTLDQMFQSQIFTVGKIQTLTGFNRGTDYTSAPIVRIYDPITTLGYKQDVILIITGLDGLFQDGELITQTAGHSARGLVKSANSTYIYAEQLRYDAANNFLVTSNSTTILVGEISGATANITQVEIDNATEYLGFNAVVDTSVQVSNGAVTELAVLGSGFGYQKNESIRFIRPDMLIDSEDAGLAFAELLNQGIGDGYYKQKGGFLSDQKKLFDGIYYQEYSYELRSSITLNKYEEMLRQLLHVAGTKYFGAFVYPTVSSVNATFQATTITSGV